MQLEPSEYKILFENTLKQVKNHVDHLLNVYQQTAKNTLNSNLVSLHNTVNRAQEFYNLYRKE